MRVGAPQPGPLGLTLQELSILGTFDLKHRMQEKRSLSGAASGDEVLRWEFTDLCQRPLVRTFYDEYDWIGKRIFALIRAAKDVVAATNRPETIRNAQYGVALLCRAIRASEITVTDLEGYHRAALRYIRQAAWADATRWNACRTTNAILTRCARDVGNEIRFTNPFPKGKSHVAVPAADELKSFRLTIRAHALQIYDEFTNRSRGPYSDLISEAQGLILKNGGLLPPAEDRQVFRFLARIYRRTGKAMDQGRWHYWDVARRFYPTAQSIMPFVILLIDGLAANVDAIETLHLDAMTKKEDILRGSTFRIELDKPRSGGSVFYGVRDSGILSIPWVFNFLREYTAPIRDLVPAPQRHFLLLMKTDNASLPKAMPAVTMYQAYKSYRAGFRLPWNIPLNSLRHANALEEFERSFDPMRVRRKLKHVSLDTSIKYIEGRRAVELDQAAIAEAQASFAKGANRKRASTVRGVRLPSHTCANPTTGSGDKERNGICSGILWPLNDEHFIMTYDARSVAFLLRDYEALKEARRRLPDARFNEAYASRLKIIEEVYIPVAMQDRQLIARARKVLTTLPKEVPLT